MDQVLSAKMNPDRLAKLPIVYKRNPDKKLSEKEEKFLREIKTYEFYNLEEPGLMIKFPYGNTQNRQNIVLMHGGKYKLPRFIAQFVESKEIPIWGWKPDGSGSIRKVRKGGKARAQMREVFE